MKATKSKLNVNLLRKVRRHILAEPRRFFMFGLLKHGKPGELYESDNGQTTTYPSCGTAACIAGWASILSGVKRPRSTSHAAHLIGLSERWEDTLSMTSPAERLFYSYNWPEPFRSRFGKSRSPSMRAKVAAARIEHLITTGE